MLRLELLNRDKSGVTVVRCSTKEESDTLRWLLHEAGYRWGSGDSLLLFDWYPKSIPHVVDYYIHNIENMVAINSCPAKKLPKENNRRTCLMYSDFVTADETDDADDSAFDDFLGALV